MNVQHFRQIYTLIQESDREGLLVEARGLTGFSGNKLVGALQRLARYQESINGGCYVEVGVYQGLTLISVASVLSKSFAFGIDNFSKLDPRNRNKAIVEERINLNRLDNVFLINIDYEDALENLIRFIGDGKIGTYFVDGPHDYRSQAMCLQLVKKYLSDSAVIIVDDCNYRHVRLANRDFLIANPEFKLIYEAYTDCHPENMAENDKENAKKSWWNGVNVIVRDPGNVLAEMYPPTLRDRALYENEHFIQSAKYGFLAPEAVSFISSVVTFKPVTAAKWLTKCVRKIRRASDETTGKHWSLNTFSEELPIYRGNPSLSNESE